MIDMEVMRNGSGYCDPTAYKAITNCMKGEKKKMELYNGDIFEIEQMNGVIKEAVVLAVHNKFVTVLFLSDNERLPYEVNCRGIKYTHPAMLQYTYNDRFRTFIRKMKDEEFNDLLKAAVESLGYEPSEKEAKKEAPVEYVRSENFMIPETEQLKTDLIKVQAERDIYKSLYENLIGNMIER